MLDHELIEILVIAIGDKRVGLFRGIRTGFLDEAEKRLAGVVEVLEVVLLAGGAERMYVEGDVFASACWSLRTCK